jgi:poly-beta-1,6-N-acetyl-D-glucosamine synthase
VLRVSALTTLSLPFGTPEHDMSTSSYIIVTPAKNEADYLPKTIAAVSSQTLRPSKWMIVNDGSSDNTNRILDEAAKAHPWIVPLHREATGIRKPGGPHIAAFYAGYDLIGVEPWDYLVKMDADVTFEPSYFESCLARFHTDPKLGIGGGAICNSIEGVLIEESPSDPLFHVRGATKIYRRACWDAIGGIIKAPGWDTFDEMKANMLGWKTCTFKNLKLHHLRPTGASYGQWKNSVKNGLSNYICGYSPLFMIAKCLKRAAASRSLAMAVGLGYGFLSGYFKRVPQVDPAVIRFVRREQLKCLSFRTSLWSWKA